MRNYKSYIYKNTIEEATDIPLKDKIIIKMQEEVLLPIKGGLNNMTLSVMLLSTIKCRNKEETLAKHGVVKREMKKVSKC